MVKLTLLMYALTFAQQLATVQF